MWSLLNLQRSCIFPHHKHSFDLQIRIFISLEFWFLMFLGGLFFCYVWLWFKFLNCSLFVFLCFLILFFFFDSQSINLPLLFLLKELFQKFLLGKFNLLCSILPRQPNLFIKINFNLLNLDWLRFLIRFFEVLIRPCLDALHASHAYCIVVLFN